MKKAAFKLISLFAPALVLAACSTTQVALFESDWTERTQTQTENNITVSASVPSGSETKALFGQNLYRKGIQPVWLEIQNNSGESVSFLPVGLDPAYYTPIEVANSDMDVSENADLNPLINRQYLEKHLGNYIPAGETRSGFVFSRLDEGTKSFNVDIVGDTVQAFFTFFVPVPGLNVDHYQVDLKALYPEAQTVEYSSSELVGLLESFPCCVENKKGTDTGDPLNIAVIGRPRDVYYAFIRAGWDETEAINKSSLWKTFKSFVGGSEYRYSPVSSLYVFDRPQDVAFQKARANIHERNHLRLWLAPGKFEGKNVWIGQISRDIGVRFTRKTITTHKIDPDVDETREYLLENLAYHQSLAKMAYVKGVGEVPIESPRGNLTGDPWFTDGYRLVIWVDSGPTDINDIEFVEWRRSTDGE